MGCGASVPDWVPNDAIPGQGQAAQDAFTKLGVGRFAINRLHHIFRRIDRDGGGSLSPAEFYAHFRLAPQRSPFADSAFLLMDADGSGAIDFREFVLAVWNLLSLTEVGLVQFAFQLYDEDGSMRLEHAEVRKLVLDVYAEGSRGGVGGARVEARVDAVLGSLKDTDPGGAVSLGEFVRLNAAHPFLLFPAFRVQQALRDGIMGRTFWRVTAARRLAQHTADNSADGSGGGAVAQDLTELLEGRTLAEHRAAVAAFGKPGQERYAQWRDAERVQEKIVEARERAAAKRRHKRERAEYQRSLKLQRKAKAGEQQLPQQQGDGGSCGDSSCGGSLVTPADDRRAQALQEQAKRQVRAAFGSGQAKVNKAKKVKRGASSRRRIVPAGAACDDSPETTTS